MPKLTDLQSLLLATAAKSADASLYPLPDSIDSKEPRVTKAIAALTKRGLTEERETIDQAATARKDGDHSYGVFITSAGLTTIGVEPNQSQNETPRRDTTTVGSSASPAPPRQTKTVLVVGLLKREGGATIAELTDATGWLPHTTRAALTGLRKHGHVIERSRRDGVTYYRITA